MCASNRNVRTADYKARLLSLPERIRILAELASRKFRAAPNHPSLRLHPLNDNEKGQHRRGSFWVSINMQYRAIFVEHDGTNDWYWIGSHADPDRFIGG